MLSFTRKTGDAVRIAEPGQVVVYLLISSVSRSGVRVELWHRGGVQPFDVVRLAFGELLEIGGTAVRLSEFEGVDRGHIRLDLEAPREIILDRVDGSEIRE